MQGTVKKYQRHGAFGFIIPDSPEVADCFVHHTFILADQRKKFLTEGDRVEFDYAEDDQGRPQARNVRKLDVPAPVVQS
jgi:cold shock CspA family protein